MRRAARRDLPGYAGVAAALGRFGLIARGGFHPGPDSAVPQLADGRGCRTVILAGNAGPAMWLAFAASPEAGDGAADPLDRWSARVLGEVAAGLGAELLLPSAGPPYLPFQRWARAAEPVHQSPLGMLIHPRFGLWHAYRGALAFAERVALPDRQDGGSPCASCAERPCLSACPVGAFTTQGYQVARCAGHLEAPQGADCLEASCRARRACPVGREFLYDAEQARFHMAAFLRARRRERSRA